MMNHEWTDRLSDYLDKGLDQAERTALEAHLTECEPCSTALDELRRVVATAAALEDAEPASDLWSAIRESIEPARDTAPVIELASRRDSVRRSPRRVHLTVPQLVAAGLALVFLSGSGALLIRPDTVVSQPDVPAGSGLAVQTVSDLGAGASAVGDSQTTELARLEELLAQHRAELSPNTIRILEKNLAAIDRAIEESLQALALDPGNDFLEGYLERSYEKKLEYLREASTTFQWST